MGKKKNKIRVSGAVKTAAKTEKRAASKLKKELANLGEEDIEKVIAQIEKEEAKRNAVVEKILNKPPEPRAYASLTSNPINNNELVMFGGEYHDGKKTIMYNELLYYNVINNEWKKIKSPGGPPPRSAHQAIVTAANKGELWIFGGEFTSPSETQFYHYKDLWKYSFIDEKWEKVQSPNGPSARSGHRMTLIGKTIYLFGGYTDNGREYKYYNDMYTFCLDSREWRKLDISGHGPSPRSGCLIIPTGNDTLLLYGGYSRIKIGKQEQSQTYRDLFRLSRNINGVWKWSEINGGGNGNMEFPRSGLSMAVNTQMTRAYVFGGITDVEETEEQLTGELTNRLQTLDLECNKWYDVTIRTAESKKTSDGDSKLTESVEGNQTEVMETSAPITVITDEVFTITLGGVSSNNALNKTTPSSDRVEQQNVGPSPRMNSMMTIQKSILYVYGGILEKDDKQFTLSDMYSLDLHKLNGWKTLIEQSDLPEWLGTDSEYGDTDESGSESDEDESEDE